MVKRLHNDECLRIRNRCLFYYYIEIYFASSAPLSLFIVSPVNYLVGPQILKHSH